METDVHPFAIQWLEGSGSELGVFIFPTRHGEPRSYELGFPFCSMIYPQGGDTHFKLVYNPHEFIN